MPSKRDIEAASAYVRLYTKGAEWTKGLKKAGTELDKFGKNIRNFGTKMVLLGAAALAPVIAAVKAYMDLGGEIQDAAERVSMSVAEFSALKFAVEQTGGSVTDLEKALRKAGITSLAQFELLAKKVAAIKSPAKQMEFVLKKLGKSGAMLINLLRQGQKGVADLVNQAEQLGLVFDEKLIATAEALGDKWEVIKNLMRRVAAEIGHALEPLIGPALDRLGTLLKGMANWINANPEKVQKIVKAILSFIAVGAALVAIGATIQFIGFTFIALAATISGITAAVAGLLPLLGKLAAAGGVAALIAQLAKASTAFAMIPETIKVAWYGITKSLKSGDIVNLFKFITEGAKILWLELVIGIKTIWADLMNWLGSKWNGFIERIVKMIYFLKSQIPTVLGGGADPKGEAAAIASALQNFGLSTNNQDADIRQDLVDLASKQNEFRKMMYDLSHDPAKALPRLPKIGAADLTDDKFKAVGTFNPFAGRSIAANPVINEIRDYTKRTAKNTDKLSLLTWR